MKLSWLLCLCNLTPDFSENFQTHRAILAIWLRVLKDIKLLPACECRWAGKGLRVHLCNCSTIPEAPRNSRKTPGWETWMLWRHFNQSSYLMRCVTPPPQGKKPGEDSRRAKAHMNGLLAKEEWTWLVGHGALGPIPANLSHRLLEELCPPPCTCWWPNDSCHKRGNARAKHKWITLRRRSFNSFSLQEVSVFAHSN